MDKVYSEECELDVIRHIAMDGDFKLLSLVNPGWFYYEPYRQVVNWWKTHPERINRSETIAACPQSIVDLAFQAPQGKFTDSAKVIERKFLQRQVDLKIDEIKRIVYTTDPQEVVIELSQFFTELGAGGIGVQKITENFTEENLVLVDFGIARPAINRLLPSRKTITVIGGESGHHKSNQCIDLKMVALEANIVKDPSFKVLMFSKEMDYDEIRHRIIAKKFKISLEKVERRQFDLKGTISRIEDEFPYLINNFLIVSPEQFRNSNDMARFLLEYKPSIWSLDFLQFTAQLMAQNKAQEQNVNVMELIATTKLLAQMTDSMGIIVSQTRKKDQNRLVHFPRLEDLEWSGLTRQLSHNICMVCWPWNIDGNLNEAVYICSWQKVRKARKFNEFMWVSPATCGFRPMSNEESAQYRKYLEV